MKLIFTTLILIFTATMLFAKKNSNCLPDSIISGELMVWNYNDNINKIKNDPHHDSLMDSASFVLDKSIYNNLKRNSIKCIKDTELIGNCMDGLPNRAIIIFVGGKNDSICLFYTCNTKELSNSIYRVNGIDYTIKISSKYQKWLSNYVTNKRKEAFKSNKLW